MGLFRDVTEKVLTSHRFHKYVVCMIRKNFYLTSEQDVFLKKRKELSESEHIRRAIDEYIQKLRNVNAITSPSDKLSKTK